jgi:N-acetylglutamate synthase-like GNAT family acetyltransferase
LVETACVLIDSVPACGAHRTAFFAARGFDRSPQRAQPNSLWLPVTRQRTDINPCAAVVIAFTRKDKKGVHPQMNAPH